MRRNYFYTGENVVGKWKKWQENCEKKCLAFVKMKIRKKKLSL